MTKKRIVVGVIFALALSPVMIIGFAYQFAQAYFDSGREAAGILVDWIDKKLG